MQKWMDRFLQRFGQPAVLYTPSSHMSVRVIFQSVNSRSWQNMQHIHEPLGRVPRGQYLCMLPAGTPASEKDSLILQGKEYEIRKLENMYWGDQVVYLWSLCVEKGA